MFLRSAMYPSSTSAAKSTKSIVNAFTQASWTSQAISNLTNSGVISALSGAMTANTLKTLLSVSGSSGQLTQLTFRTNDVTARTIRVKITVDGIVACDSTSASISTSGNGGVWSGTKSTATYFVLPPIFWKSTLVIEYASSLSETDKITAEYVYNTES